MNMIRSQLECPICGVKHRKYPVNCASRVNRGYDLNLIRYSAEQISSFHDYCNIKGFTREVPITNRFAEDYYERIKRENDEKIEIENAKAFFNIDKELFRL